MRQRKCVWAAEENVKREKKMSSSKTIVGKDELLYASMNARWTPPGRLKRISNMRIASRV